jgi:hypothetical protein
VHFGQRFNPGGNAGGYLSLASGPSPDKTIIAFKRSRKTALRPAQRGQTFPKAFGRHGHINLVTVTATAAAAPVNAAPVAKNPMPTCQTESSWSRLSLRASAASLWLSSTNLRVPSLYRAMRATCSSRSIAVIVTSVIGVSHSNQPGIIRSAMSAYCGHELALSSAVPPLVP